MASFERVIYLYIISFKQLRVLILKFKNQLNITDKKLFSDPDPISSEPVDWLGFSRLGSPDTGHRRLEDGDSIPDKHGSDSKDTSILKSSKDKKIGSVPVTGSEIGDWLDKSEVSHSVGSPNWLNGDAKRMSGKNDEKNTFLSDFNVEKKRNSLDFLGASSEKDNDDDWLNTLHKKQPDNMEARPQSAPDRLELYCFLLLKTWNICVC